MKPFLLTIFTLNCLDPLIHDEVTLMKEPSMAPTAPEIFEEFRNPSSTSSHSDFVRGNLSQPMSNVLLEQLQQRKWNKPDHWVSGIGLEDCYNGRDRLPKIVCSGALSNTKAISELAERHIRCKVHYTYCQYNFAELRVFTLYTNFSVSTAYETYLVTYHGCTHVPKNVFKSFSLHAHVSTE